MSSFSDLPSNASLKPKPFKAHVPDQDLSDFKQLLKLSRIGPKTYENSVADVKDFTSFGITRDWLVQTKQYLLGDQVRLAQDRRQNQRLPQFHGAD
jgi:microsomal epoxide hydrolase